MSPVPTNDPEMSVRCCVNSYDLLSRSRTINEIHTKQYILHKKPLVNLLKTLQLRRENTTIQVWEGKKQPGSLAKTDDYKELGTNGDQINTTQPWC